MPALPEPAQRLPLKAWGAYLLKAVVLVGVVCLVGHFAPSMPAPLVAVLWAVLSAVAAIGLAYPFVMRKAHKQSLYTADGYLSRINNGRTLRLVVCFVTAAVCMFGLIMGMPTWGAAEWTLAALSIPLYLGVSIVARRLVEREVAPLYRTERVVGISWIATALVLCVIYLVISLALPGESYNTLLEAQLAAGEPFGSSSSPLVADVGKIVAFLDAVKMYAASQAAHSLSVAYPVCRMLLYASAFFGLASVLSVCYLSTAEVKSVFAPLPTEQPPRTVDALVKRYVAVAVALPLCLVAAFIAVDWQVSKASASGELTAAESFVSDQIDLAVYLIDGKCYEQKAVDDLVGSLQEQSATLSADAHDILVPLINASYDKRVENVDEYLDWYYSLPADYERLAKMVTGEVDDFVADQLSAKLEDGVDDSELLSKLNEYSEQASQLEAQAQEQLEGLALPEVPDWLVKTETALDGGFLSQPLEPAEQLVSAPARLGISGAAGVATGVLAKKVVTKAIQKQFFGKAVSRIGSALGTRAAGAAAGGAVGTLAGPLGTVLGVAGGTLAAVGVDYALLNIDEMQNRESYKAEIVDAIEEERAEMLALVP